MVAVMDMSRLCVYDYTTFDHLAFLGVASCVAACVAFRVVFGVFFGVFFGVASDCATSFLCCVIISFIVDKDEEMFVKRSNS